MLLQQPGRMGPLRLKNRVMTGPMGTNFGTTDGFSTERDKIYYAERARGGAAMIITEAMVVSGNARNHRASLCIFDDRFIQFVRRDIMSEVDYELFALRYATREARRGDHFIGGDPHDGPMPMDYFVWVARGGGRTFVIDTGFNAEVSARRKRTFLRDPVEALAALGIDANTVQDVILTHLHYDHVGNFDRFPKARFHLHEPELAYATGRYMRYPRLSHSFEVEDVCGIVRLNYAQRVVFYNGDAELASGVSVHAVGGHSAGLQFVRVKTARGFVVLASDVTHFYENMASSRPFTTAFHIGEMLEGFDRLLQLAPDEGHIVPGHDPLVMKLYPAPSPELEGIAVRLDVPPSAVAPKRADYSSQH